MNKIRHHFKKKDFEELKNLILDDKVKLIFCVYIEDNIETRYKIEKPKDELEFYNFIKKNMILCKDGIDSDNFKFLDCDYIDLYY
jgi:hypothetical protein